MPEKAHAQQFVERWTNDRLKALFDRYRVRYWPRSRRLRRYRIESALLRGPYGRCSFEERVLLIDLCRHPSEREIRSTVLHEMAHAVVGRGGHRAAFWTELESLLRQRAPITVGFPELGEAGKHLCVVPNRFRRCRKFFAPVYRRQQRELERQISQAGMPSYDYTTGDMETECFDAAFLNGATWRDMWPRLAATWGFVDLDGCLLPWARKWRDAARRGYVRGRRSYLEEKRHGAEWEARCGTLSTPRSNGLA